MNTRIALTVGALGVITAVTGLTVGALTPATAPAVACGSSPGFCPNPPTDRQTHTVTPDGTVGTGQDF